MLLDLSEFAFSFAVFQQYQESSFSFLSAGQQSCCLSSLCRVFQLWITGKLEEHDTDLRDWIWSLQCFLKPNHSATVLLTVLQTLTSVGSSKKTRLGKLALFDVGKNCCITSMSCSLNPVWIFFCQVWGEISTWFLKAGSWEKPSIETAVLVLRHELLSDWKDFRWRRRFSALICGKI